jgi:hypothetical protein
VISVAGTVPDRDRTLSVSSPARWFLAIRRARTVGAIVATAAVLTALLGSYTAKLPSAADGGTVLPLWRLLTLAVAVVPVMSLHSSLAALEVTATRRFRRSQTLYLSLTTVAATTAHLLVSAITVPVPVLLVMLRSYPAWLGLALFGGVLLGWRSAWTIPVGTAAILWFWGISGGRYHWWDFSGRPYDDVPSLLLSLCLLAAGSIAYCATPWRRRQVGRRTR